ncbi:MAG: hypothetical protein JNK04_14490, partial [Myxococcales bacterium]|nr:hypothetical protein [Myxococcales bacterium]
PPQRVRTHRSPDVYGRHPPGCQQRADLVSTDALRNATHRRHFYSLAGTLSPHANSARPQHMIGLHLLTVPD